MTTRGIVAENLLAIRTARGLTQAEVAELANLPRTYVLSIEHGEVNFTIDTIEQLALALRVQTSVLFIEGAFRSMKPRGKKKKRRPS